MAQSSLSVIRSKLWRVRRRLLVALCAVTAAIRCWDGWTGWTVGLVAGAGVLLFEFREWWDDEAEHRSQQGDDELTGPARFREAGPTTVQLLHVGSRPDVVARRLRVVTDLDEAGVAELMASAPVALPRTLSLRSAERVIDGLRNAGADAQLRIHVDFSADSPGRER